MLIFAVTLNWIELYPTLNPSCGSLRPQSQLIVQILFSRAGAIGWGDEERLNGLLPHEHARGVLRSVHKVGPE